MKLSELLDPSRVLVPLKARSVRDATRQLARALSAAGAVRDEMRLTELLKTEWPEDVVTVEGRAFLPHFRTDAVKELAVALGVAPEPLRLGDDPGRSARVVVLVLAPTGEASVYLRAMSAVARALASDEVLDGMHRAAGAGDVLALPGLAETDVPADVTVADLMNRSVTSVGPDTALGEAARLMLSRGIGALPVTAPGGEVLGMLTDGHLLRFLLPQAVTRLGAGTARRRRTGAAGDRGTGGPGPESASVPVREVMDRSVLCVADDQTVADVTALMMAKNIDRFPVTRDGALVGFLTRGDIVRKLLGT